MSEGRGGSSTPGTAAAATNSLRSAWSGLAGWQRIAMILSIVVMGGAIGLQAAGVFDSAPEAAATPVDGGTDPGAASGSGLARGFAPDGTPLPPDDAEAAEEPVPDDLSPAIFRLGFSFFMGFAIAFALRTFVRVSLVAIGLFAVLLFGMQYAGFLEVNWTAIGDRYDDAQGWIEREFDSFRAFITGYLPSAAAATLGLMAGFKRG